MAYHKNILLAADFTEETRQLVERAESFKVTPEVTLNLIYVLRPMHLSYGDHVPTDVSCIQEQIYERSKRYLAELGRDLNIPCERQILAQGSPELEIPRLAKEHDCDLIVVGCHGKQGLLQLFGSTASDVIQNAHCDVLAVHLQDLESAEDASD